MAKDYVFTPPPNWPAPPRGWVPPPGWTPDPEWGPAPEGWEFWTLPEGGAASWFGQHPVLAGIAATTLVIGGVVGITAFANGSNGKAPVAAESTTQTLLTAIDSSSGEETPDESLSSSTEDPSESPTESESPTTSSPTKTPTTTPTKTPTETPTTSTGTRTGPRSYATCTAMNKDHPHGVGRPGARDRVQDGQKRVRNFEVNLRLYLANITLDTDFDGIACER